MVNINRGDSNCLIPLDPIKHYAASNFVKIIISAFCLAILLSGISAAAEQNQDTRKTDINVQLVSSQGNKQIEWVSFPLVGSKPMGSEPEVVADTIIEKAGSGGKIALNYKIPGAFREKSDKGALLRIPTASFSLEEGRPVLPGIVATFIVPGNVKFDNICVCKDEVVYLKEENPILHQIIANTPEGLRKKRLLPNP